MNIFLAIVFLIAAPLNFLFAYGAFRYGKTVEDGIRGSFNLITGLFMLVALAALFAQWCK